MNQEAYISGFLTKCAEEGIPYEVADAMLKQAWNFTNSWDDVSQFQRGMARDMREKGIDEAYLRSMGKRGRRLLKVMQNPNNLPGTWFNRHLNPFSYNATDQLNKYKQEYNDMLGERERIKERTNPQAQGYRPGDPHATRTNVPGQGLVAWSGAGNGDRVAAPAGKPQDRYADLMEGRLDLPTYSNHQLDAKTGKLYRADGKQLDPGAEYWNARMDYNRAQLDEWNKSHPPAAPGAPGAPGAAPAKPKYSPAQERENQVFVDVMNGAGPYAQ